MRIFTLAVLTALAAAPAYAEGHHWSYEGDTGPEHWADACKGSAQTPIDLAQTNSKGPVAYSVSYKPVPLAVRNLGHTIQFSGEDAGALIEAGVEYKLIQVHFHTPSEHVVDGKHYPLEGHFVHVSDKGALSVLGAFFTEGAENPALATLLKHMPKKPGGMIPIEGASIDPNALLPKDQAIYRYNGSLTTPPCSEGVQWHVLATPVTASKKQIEAIRKLEGMNARPVQKLNDRLVVAP